MPIYEYQCSNCGHELDELQTMNEPPLIKCPKCGKDTLKRLIGTGGGLIFKGSGFYLTDYKNKPKETKASPIKNKDSKPEQKSAESKNTKTSQSKASENKTSESKSNNKTESKK